jgi:serine/threonine-protein kinase
MSGLQAHRAMAKMNGSSTNLPMRSFEGAVLDGRYRLVRYLNEGAFGAVFQGSHLVYELELREVAVKVAKRPMSESEARRTFGEALLLAKLTEACLDPVLRQQFVSVYDAGRCGESGPLAGHPYVAMEYVSGGTLKDCLRAGPFPLTRAIAYFDQLLKAVAFMHAKYGAGSAPRNPVVHRDLKPSNILVRRRTGEADLLKLADFGLAVEVGSLLGWVESGGDLAYLAPESFSHDLCSPQSDVYMLGLVFYEMIAGLNPFAEVGRHLRGDDEAKRAELRRLHLAARQGERFEELRRHEELRRRPKLAGVIRAALQADLCARTFGDAGELRAAWEEAKHASGGPAPKECPWDKVKRLLGEAQQCLALAEEARGEALLRAAMALNQDPAQVPDQKVVTEVYLLMVERLLRQGQTDQAGQLANEGYRRRRGRLTCLAMARYYEAVGSPLAACFQQEAGAYPDQP